MARTTSRACDNRGSHLGPVTGEVVSGLLGTGSNMVPEQQLETGESIPDWDPSCGTGHGGRVHLSRRRGCDLLYVLACAQGLDAESAATVGLILMLINYHWGRPLRTVARDVQCHM